MIASALVSAILASAQPAQATREQITLRGTVEARAKNTQKTIAEVSTAMRSAIPAARFGDAAEFGAACAFLCSAHAGYLVGQNILLDGGNYPGTF